MSEYQPELLTVKKDDIYAAINALSIGYDHATATLKDHDVKHGRITRKDKIWAEQIERDIDAIEKTLERLRQHTMPA